MTNWTPSDLPGTGPIYLRLADRIAADIQAGHLPAGAKLPPQRDLAYELGVTIGTVGRAYAVARERGLVAGEVGRGTYVIDTAKTAPYPPGDLHFDAGTRVPDAAENVIRFDSSAAPMVGQAEMIGTIMQSVIADLPEEVSSYTRRVRPSWREAGRRWLSTATWSPQTQDIFPTLGAHAGAVAAIVAVTNPGDYIVIEELSYASIGRAATLAGRRVLTVGLDEDGIDTGELERICASQHPKVLFLMPALQNPTLAVLSRQRRQEVVDIARRHNVWLIEDVIYGAVAGDPLPGLGELAPERTFVVGGLSKSVAAGVRGGWLACPPGMIARTIISHKLMTGGMPFLVAEMAARLVNQDIADKIRERVREEIETRRAIAENALAGLDILTRPNSPFLWMTVPTPWQPGTLKKAAENEDILIDSADEFLFGASDKAIRKVRLGFTAPFSLQEVERGMRAIRSLTQSDCALYDTYS